MAEIIISSLRAHGISWNCQGQRCHKTFTTEERRDWFMIIALDNRAVDTINRWASFRHGDPLSVDQHEELENEVE